MEQVQNPTLILNPDHSSVIRLKVQHINPRKIHRLKIEYELRVVKFPQWATTAFPWNVNRGRNFSNVGKMGKLPISRFMTNFLAIQRHKSP